MRQAAEYARRGGGAVLIEAKDYRRKGHAEHDDQRYSRRERLSGGRRTTIRSIVMNDICLTVILATKEKLEEIVGRCSRD